MTKFLLLNSIFRGGSNAKSTFFSNEIPQFPLFQETLTLTFQFLSLSESLRIALFLSILSVCNSLDLFSMATKPLTSKAIALTEKKMDMTLDDIIKMSKTNAAESKKQRVSNKSWKFSNGNQNKSLKMSQYMDSRSNFRQGVLAQRRSNFPVNSFPLASEAVMKARFAPSRNRSFNQGRAVTWNKRRGVGPLRRQGNTSNGSNGLKHHVRQQQQQQQQPSQTAEAMPKQKPKTLDSLFANMKEQRMRAVTHTSNGGAVRRGGAGVSTQPRQPWLRGRFGNYRN